MRGQRPSPFQVARVGFVIFQLALAACSPYGASLGDDLPDGANATGAQRSASFTLVGPLQGLGAGSVTVGGHLLSLSLSIPSGGELQPGEQVRVSGVVLPDGSFLGLEIEPAPQASGPGHLELTGAVDSISASELVVAGLALTLPDGMDLDPSAVPGAMVELEAALGADGSLVITDIEVQSGHDAGHSEAEEQDGGQLEGQEQEEAEEHPVEEEQGEGEKHHEGEKHEEDKEEDEKDGEEHDHHDAEDEGGDKHGDEPDEGDCREREAPHEGDHETDEEEHGEDLCLTAEDQDGGGHEHQELHEEED